MADRLSKRDGDGDMRQLNMGPQDAEENHYWRQPIGVANPTCMKNEVLFKEVIRLSSQKSHDPHLHNMTNLSIAVTL